MDGFEGEDYVGQATDGGSAHEYYEPSSVATAIGALCTRGSHTSSSSTSNRSSSSDMTSSFRWVSPASAAPGARRRPPTRVRHRPQ